MKKLKRNELKNIFGGDAPVQNVCTTTCATGNGTRVGCVGIVKELCVQAATCNPASLCE